MRRVVAITTGTALAATVVAFTGTMAAAAPVAADVAWQACTEEKLSGLQCATLDVPMDYDNPGGETVPLAITRHRATDPAAYRGVLLTNPGGPGAEGRSMPLEYANQAIAKHFDIIGIDVRGVGASAPLQCDFSDVPLAELSAETRPAEEDFGTYGNAAKEMESDCERDGGTLRPFVTTPNIARDMDQVREALGQEQINYLGVSYGTWLGAVYGQMFPDRLNRSVLDSALDPTQGWYEQTTDNNESAKFNFDEWAKWVAARDGTFALGTTAEAVREKIDAIAFEAADRPGWAGIIDQDVFDATVGEETRYRPEWKFFADLMGETADVLDGVEPSAELVKKNKDLGETIRSQAEPEPTAYYAITCDWAWPTVASVYYDNMRQWRDSFPYGKTAPAMMPGPCTYNPDQGNAHTTIGPRQYPQGLVLNSDGDTQTSLVNAQQMAETLAQPLITVRGEGTHSVFAMASGNLNSCVDDQVNGYLIDGTEPTTLECASSNPPADVPVDGT